MSSSVRTIRPFRLIYELRPPVRPSLDEIRRQVGTFRSSGAALLLPENAIGIPTISSVAAARAVIEGGAHPIACLNARDRNPIGLWRDLLTASEIGIEEFLFVAGDAVSDGERGSFSVRAMLEEFEEFRGTHGTHGALAHVAASLAPLPQWKRDAGGLFVQATYSLEELLAWRSATEFSGPVYAGVLIPPSAERARRWNRELAGITVPKHWIDALERDPLAGVDLGCELLEAIASSGAFDGVHCIPGVRYREVAAALERSEVVTPRTSRLPHGARQPNHHLSPTIDGVAFLPA